MIATVMAAVGMVMMDSGQLTSGELDRISAEVVAETRAQYPDENLTDSDIAVTVLAIDRVSGSTVGGDKNGDVAMYPASVVKAFYMAYAAYLVDQGDLVLSEEAKRAARDMIVDSSNDATGYMIDLVCGTTPGPELPENELREFGRKRQAVNRWFKSLGYQNVNAVQRTYNEGPYGREAQWVGKDYSNRNMLTSNNCARLMADVALGTHWSEEQTEWMRSLLGRANPVDEPDKTDGQAREFAGKVIPSGTKLYSKAGLTSQVRHDAVWLVMPDGREFAMALFTKRGRNTEMVSFMAAEVLKRLGYEPLDPFVAVVEEDEEI